MLYKLSCKVSDHTKCSYKLWKQLNTVLFYSYASILFFSASWNHCNTGKFWRDREKKKAKCPPFFLQTSLTCTQIKNSHGLFLFLIFPYKPSYIIWGGKYNIHIYHNQHNTYLLWWHKLKCIYIYSVQISFANFLAKDLKH